ncbi:hypothetical protein ACEN2S_05490 [Phaeovulum sp. W22_SRMD_FR3]
MRKEPYSAHKSIKIKKIAYWGFICKPDSIDDFKKIRGVPAGKMTALQARTVPQSAMKIIPLTGTGESDHATDPQNVQPVCRCSGCRIRCAFCGAHGHAGADHREIRDG